MLGEESHEVFGVALGVAIGVGLAVKMHISEFDTAFHNFVRGHGRVNARRDEAYSAFIGSDGQTPWCRNFFGVDKYALWGNFNKTNEVRVVHQDTGTGQGLNMLAHIPVDLIRIERKGFVAASGDNFEGFEIGFLCKCPGCFSNGFDVAFGDHCFGKVGDAKDC